MSEAGPQVNGLASPSGKYIDLIDPDDPEYIKNLQRPAEVKEDLQQMENRSRVKVILNSQAFKEELEQVVEEQLRSGPFPASLIALQQITDLLLPNSKGGLGSLARASAVIPINDLRGVESLGFAKGEKLLRCKLAALYRLVDLCGWSHGIHNHITARVSAENEHFLLSPFGLTYSEVTASSLVKVDVNGDVVDPGSTHLGSYKAGFSVHAAIHQARPDIKCIVHLHTPAAVAVSALKCGLLPMSQEALLCGNISYHDFQGVIIDAEEREKLVRNLGVHNKVLVLRNRGILACGETVEEAFHYTSNVMAACEIQVKAIPLGLDNIVIPSEDAREQAHKKVSPGSGGGETKERKWKTGELEFEALMRSLDNSGYRTGYAYKMPVVKQEKKERSNSEVEIPPASSSFTYIFDGDYLHSKYASPIQAAKERQKNAFKAGWMTTPNTYKKTEIEEIGTTTPKKITKWVSEGDSPNRPGGTPVKIENPNQFAPQGDNPKEFKLKQKSIRKDYYEEKVTAGPQSKILEGITWDEVQKAKDGQLNVSGDQLIVVGAASKGIIQRDHQHNAVLYRNFYAANPFENMSEAEIEQYQAEVQRKERGEPAVEDQIPPPSDEVSSFEQPQEPEKQDTDVAEPAIPEKATKEPIGDIRPSHSPTGHDFEENQQTAMAGTICDHVSIKQLDHECQAVTVADSLLQQNVNHSGGSQVIYDHTKCSQEPLSNQNTKSVVGSELDKDFTDDDSLDAHSQSSCRDHIGVLHAGSTAWGGSCETSMGIAQEVNWQEPALNSEDDFVTIQLNPIQLYHGHSDHGVMKVRFSIQSTVRRRIRAELSRGGTTEEVYSSISEPFVENFETSSDCLEHPDIPVGHNIYISQVNVRKNVRRIKQPAWCYKQPKRPVQHIENQTSVIPGVSGSKAAGYLFEDHLRYQEPPETAGHVAGDTNETGDSINSFLPGIHNDDSAINMGEIVRLNSGLEETVRQTPSGSHVVGREDKRSDKPMRDTSSSDNKSVTRHRPTNSFEGAQNYHASTCSVGPDKEEKAFDKVPVVTTIQSDHVHDADEDDDDIMYADEESDDNLVLVTERVEGQLKQTERESKVVFQKRGENKKILNRKLLPPPPLPPSLKPQNMKPKKRLLKQKIAHVCPPLSPVKEEFGGTVEEMEEMEAILEEADDSFEQLLLSAEDELLVSPKTDQNSNDERLDLMEFLGAAPMAFEEDFDFCEVNDNPLPPPPNGSIELTKGVDQVCYSEVRLLHDAVSSQSQEKADLVATGEDASKMTDNSPNCSPNEGRESVEEFPLSAPSVHYFIPSGKKEPGKANVYIERKEINESITRKTETNSDITPGKESPYIETDIDGVIPPVETEIDEVIYPIETEIDKAVPYIETEINEVFPCKETNIDVISLSKEAETGETAEFSDMISLKKTETNVNSATKSKKVESNEFTLANANEMSKISRVFKKKETMQHSHVLNIDEGPVQTSSPKLGRVKSKESPFKPYLQKLGKSEETLLDIMPLEGQKPQISAKSHEELEGTAEDKGLKSLLSRSKSLGPHHVNKKKQKQTHSPLPTKSKETLINDFSDSGSPEKESFQSPRAFLTEHALMRHCEMMKLSSARGVFKPSPKISALVKGEIMPPLPDTTEVPSVSDNEESSQPYLTSRKQTGKGDHVIPHNVVSTSNLALKQRWVPKQKRERTRHYQEENYRRVEPRNRESGSERQAHYGSEDLQKRRQETYIDDDRNNKPARIDEYTQGLKDEKQRLGKYSDRTRKNDEQRKVQVDGFVEEYEKQRVDKEEELPETGKKREKRYKHTKGHDESGTNDNDDSDSGDKNYSISRGDRNKKTQDSGRGGTELEEKRDRNYRQKEKKDWSRKLSQGMEEYSHERSDNLQSLVCDLSVNTLGEPHHKVDPEKEQSIMDAEHLAQKKGLDRDGSKRREEKEGAKRRDIIDRKKYEEEEEGKHKTRWSYDEDILHDDERKKWRRKDKKVEKSDDSDQHRNAVGKAKGKIEHKDDDLDRRVNHKTQSADPESEAFIRDDRIEIKKYESNLKRERTIEGPRATSSKDMSETSAGDFNVKHLHEKELSPVDKFLRSSRMEIDAENSPRLQRRRGGAIAHMDDHDKRKGKGKREEYNRMRTSQTGSKGIENKSKGLKINKDPMTERTGEDTVAVEEIYKSVEAVGGSGSVPDSVVYDKDIYFDDKIENKKSDGHFYEKDRSTIEVEADSNVLDDKHDENRGSDLYKNSKNKSPKHSYEASLKTRREGDRWQPVRSRKSSSDADKIPEGDGGFSDRKSNKHSRHKPVEVVRADKEEQLYPTGKSLTDVSSIQDEENGSEKVENRLKKPDLNIVGRIKSVNDTDKSEDVENSKPFFRGQEQQKYAGFVRRSGRGARKSQPVRSAGSRDGGTGDRSEDQDWGDSKMGSKNNRLSKTVNPHEDQEQDFDSLIRGNPIDISFDDNLEENDQKPHSRKKSVFNLLSCVGGKSSGAAKAREKYKKEIPTAYYEEGEKKKIKKLSREKKKEERSLHYFEKSEEDSDNVDGDNNKIVRALDEQTKTEDITQEPPLLPETKLAKPLPAARRSERYLKRTPFQQSKPLSTFTDSAEMLEALASSNDYDDSHKREQGHLSQSSVANIERPQQPELATFQSFGKSTATKSSSKHATNKPDHDNNSQIELNATTYSKQKRKKKGDNKRDMHSSAEDAEMATKDKPVHISNEEIVTENLQLMDSRDGESEQTFSMEIGKTGIVEDVQKTQKRQKNEYCQTPKVRLNDSVPDLPQTSAEVEDAEKQVTASVDIILSPPAENFDLNYEYPSYHFSSSVPEHFNTDQRQTSEQSHILASGNSMEPHLLNSSYDPSTLFDPADVQHRRHHRTVSFDDGFHPLKRQISETSLGSESTMSRPRSTSSVTNPLIYEPWRAKADRKKRSLSVSEMVYAKGVARPVRTHSVGEVYNSTVASSVARRRARTPHSGDITSRMYQPRHHNRSHSSLGDTSFGSSRPYRQRSFSGFDSSSRSPDPSVTAVTVKRSESARQTDTSPQIVKDLQHKNVEKSKPVQHQKLRELGEDKPVSPSKSDTLKSADSASGGETLEERSSKEGSPTKEKPSPTKEKKKKKKFHIPSFAKKKSKEHKESTA